MPVLQSYGLGLVPFSPLANGLLTGKYRRDAPPPAGTRLAAMPHIAERYLTEANWDDGRAPRRVLRGARP